MWVHVASCTAGSTIWYDACVVHVCYLTLTQALICSFLLLSNLVIIILYYYGQLGSDGSGGKMDGVPLTCQSRRGDGVSASVRLGKRTVWRHIICPKTAVSVRGHMLRVVAVVGCLLHVSATSSSSLLAAQPAPPPLDSTRLGLNLRGIAGIIVTTFLPHALLFFVLCFQFIIVVEDRSWRGNFHIQMSHTHTSTIVIMNKW